VKNVVGLAGYISQSPTGISLEHICASIAVLVRMMNMELVSTEKDSKGGVTKKDKGDKFFKAMEKFHSASKMLSMGFLVMGEALKEIKTGQLWRLDGNHIQSWRQWVEGELRISYSQSLRLIQVYDEAGRFLSKPEFNGMDIYKVVLLLPQFEGKTDEEKLELLYMAKECKINDIKDNIRAMKGEPVQGECNHEDYEATIWNQCSHCKKFYR
jgi:hypothetical protein